ncbi:hypothetical protein PAPYR_695 [Paratrimastix pyriformis]|uniref:Uncharacterized protein n=1 Tax=Paratrimastix pyriformis TaxID=342808 RepID=A0ABQ8UU77_9EUKA|nr:hypothetical protein PAPYR_695 [Paratrimastix pyriformis]
MNSSDRDFYLGQTAATHQAWYNKSTSDPTQAPAASSVKKTEEELMQEMLHGRGRAPAPRPRPPQQKLAPHELERLCARGVTSTEIDEGTTTTGGIGTVAPSEFDEMFGEKRPAGPPSSTATRISDDLAKGRMRMFVSEDVLPGTMPPPEEHAAPDAADRRAARSESMSGSEEQQERKKGKAHRRHHRHKHASKHGKHHRKHGRSSSSSSGSSASSASGSGTSGGEEDLPSRIDGILLMALAHRYTCTHRRPSPASGAPPPPPGAASSSTGTPPPPAATSAATATRR